MAEVYSHNQTINHEQEGQWKRNLQPNITLPYCTWESIEMME